MSDDENLQVEAEVKEVPVPDWIPEKFRSNPEEFGKAYGNLEREFHDTRRQLKEQQETMELFIAESQQARPVENNNEAIYAAYENDPVGTAAWLAREAAANALAEYKKEQEQSQKPVLQTQNDLLAYTVDQMVAQEIPDWAEQKQRVGDFLRENPYLLPQGSLDSPQTTSKTLVAAYKAMRFDEIQNQGKTQAETLLAENEQLKRQAQTLSGSPGRPAATDADNDYWQRVQNAPRGGL